MMKKTQILGIIFLCFGQVSLLPFMQPIESTRLTRESNGDDIEWQTSLSEVIRTLEKLISKQKNEIESMESRLKESEDTIAAQNQRIRDLENSKCQSSGGGNQLSCDAAMSKKIASLEEKVFNQKKEIKQLKEDKLNQADKIKDLEDSIKKIKPEQDELIESVDELKTTSEEQGTKVDGVVNRIDKLQAGGSVSGGGGGGGGDICSKTGDELAKLMKEGTLVVRGEDWSWGDQDDNGEGKVIDEVGSDKWIRVEWDNGHRNNYRMGAGGKYDLKLAQCRDK